MSGLALIAGGGHLPAAIAASLGTRPLIASLAGHAPRGIEVDVEFRLERLVPFLDHLLAQGIDRVILAGAVRRPRLDPALFDAGTAQLLPRLLEAMQDGDDATLRAVIGIVEEAGLRVEGVTDVAPALVPGEGTLAGEPSEADRRDAARAALIAAAIGAVDVGQGCVVQQGLCLGVEALPGTDAMLQGVAHLPVTLRPDPAKGRGVLFKGAKPGQDRRADLPTIGRETLIRVVDAGLGGIVWQAGSVIVLDRDALVEEARASGVFLWSRAP